MLGAHELEVGRTYYILPTTSYGLYRYNIYDVVRCTGFYNKTPLIEFLSKGSHFANITGEKLSEYQVTEAVTATLRDLNMNLTAYTMAPCWDDEQPYYGLFIEKPDMAEPGQGLQLLHGLENRLRRINIEYAAKRDSCRLGPPRLLLLPEHTWLQWDRQRLLKTGGTLEQYKHPCLIADPTFRSNLPVIEELRVAI